MLKSTSHRRLNDMETSRGFEDRAVKIIRWTARILGTLLLLLVAAFAIGEGFPNPSKLTTTESLLMVAFVIMLLGIIVAWRWEGTGGALLLVGFASFWAVNIVATLRFWWPGWVFALFGLVGLLFLSCWWRARASSKGR